MRERVIDSATWFVPERGIDGALSALAARDPAGPVGLHRARGRANIAALHVSPRIAQHGVIGGLVLLAACAAGLPAQQVDPLARLQAVERLVAAGDVEGAVLELWSAEAALDPAHDDAIARSLRADLGARLAKHDPLAEQRAAARRRVAAHWIELARTYGRKKWFRTGRELLDVAARDDAEAAAKATGYFDKQLERARQAPAAAPPEPPPGPASLLATFEPLIRAGNWQTTPEMFASPPLADRTHYILSQEPQHGEHRLLVDVKLGDVAGIAAFAFGVTGAQSYWFVSLEHEMLAADGPSRRDVSSHLGLYRFDAEGSEDAPAKWLAGEHATFTAAERAGWLTIEVLVRGRTIECGIGARARFQHTAKSDVRGGVGFVVPHNSAHREPVLFRDLRIEPLPDMAAPELPATARRPEQGVVDAIASAEATIAAGEPEAACEVLRAARREVAGLDSAAVRRVLLGTIAGLERDADPCASARADAERAIAREWIALAGAYQDAGRPFCARAVLEHAATFDEEATVAPRAALDAVLAPLLEQRFGFGPDAGALEPTDNRALQAAFASARQYWGTEPWDLARAVLVSPRIVGDGSALLLGGSDSAATRASVQFRQVDGRGGAAIVFAAKSQFDFHLFNVHHAPAGTYVQVLHYKSEWRQLAEATLRFSDEARATWTTLSVEFGGGTICARVGKAPPLVVANAGPLAGRFGLLAESVEGVTGRIEFRNWRAGE